MILKAAACKSTFDLLPAPNHAICSGSRNTREWGVETPLISSVIQFLEAGWHARMSSRFAGKGACAYDE
nr:hypothetical protein [Sphingomonas sp. Y57]